MADIVSLIGGVILMLMLFLALVCLVSVTFQAGWLVFFATLTYSLVLFGFLLGSFVTTLN